MHDRTPEYHYRSCACNGPIKTVTQLRSNIFRTHVLHVYTHLGVFTNIFELNLISIHSVLLNALVRENNCSVMYAYAIFRAVSGHICWLVEKKNMTKRRFILEMSEAFNFLIRHKRFFSLVIGS